MYRRQLINGAGAALSLLPLAGIAEVPRKPASRHSRQLRVLMLGGTGFLGPSIVETLLDRGHLVTLFNRGTTNTHLFRYLEQLRGDREQPDGKGLGALRNREWDVVVDTWQGGPQCVEDTARLLSGSVGAYYYTSSIAVYHRDAYDKVDASETDRLSDMEGHTISRDPDEHAYFLRKSLAEKILVDQFDGSVGLLRAHGIRGARIRTPQSEHYWPVKVWRGGDVLAPEDGQTWAQFTDTLSYCRFIAHCAENNLSGPFNVMSEPFRLGAFFDAVRRVSQRRANLIWTSRETLADHGIEPYRDLPLWRPEPVGFYRFSVKRAAQAGFEHRSLTSCAASKLHGYCERHPNDGFKFGRRGQITDEKEREVLAALRHAGSA